MKRAFLGFCSASLLSALGLIGCGQPIETSASLDSVDIPQTAVENQNKIGYCWAYATTGFIESVYKSKTGQQVNLSEEAMGYYRAIEQMRDYVKVFQEDPAVTFEELKVEVQKNTFQGWILRKSENMKITVRDSYELVSDFGVVPESVWNYKFDTKQKTDFLVSNIQKGFISLLKIKGKTLAVTDAELEKIATRAFKSAPPKSFVNNGIEITAKDYAKNVLKFNFEDYATIDASSSRDIEKLVIAVKRSLGRGLSVPIGFGVNFALLKSGTWSFENKNDAFYDNIAQEKAKAFFGADGGHAVLVTDFVNKDGQEGLISEEALKSEISKPVEELNYLKIKNSWGTAATSNEAGKTVDGAEDGYYKLDLGYLKGNADAGFLTVVVPKDLALSSL